MDLGMILDIIILLLIIYAISKKVMGWRSLKKYEDEGAVVFRNQTTKVKIFQYTCLVIGIILAGLYVYRLALGQLAFSLNYSSFILFFLYFGFLPTSSGYWALTRKGVFIYLYDRFLTWPELITIGFEKKNEKKEDSPYFLTLVVKKGKSDYFKQSHYRCMVPTADKDQVEEFINNERKKVDRIRLRQKNTSYYDELQKNKKKLR